MDFWFPMYAASFGGKNNACMWLHKHGAAEDVGRQTLLNDLSPLKVSFDMFRFRELSRWLILEGALSKADEPGILDIENMLNDINRWDCVLEREMLLQWAKEKLETRISFLQFLNGTFSPPEYSVSNLHRELAKRTRCESAADILLSSMPPEQKRLLWEKLFHEKGESPLKVFAGKNGILKSIGDFAGVVHGQKVGIIRQLTERLPDFNGISARMHEEYNNDDYSDGDSISMASTNSNQSDETSSSENGDY